MNKSISLDHSPLLKTKLYPPPITPDLVPRIELLERLEWDRQRPLTLISAPAGYGKSILASMWLQASSLPGGWVSLDGTDNDLRTFVSYVLAAIQTAVPAKLSQTQALLKAPSIPSGAILARHLLAELDQIETPFLLILDDIHHIRAQGIFTFLDAGCAWLSLSESKQAAADVMKKMVSYFGPYLEEPALNPIGLSTRDMQPLKTLIDAGDYEGASNAVTDDMLKLGITGTPADVIERIEALAAMGVDEINLGGPLGPDPETAIRLMGERVIPHFS